MHIKNNLKPENAAEVLEKLREKLLNLTALNNLLNYKHPSTRSVRIVNELPNQVYKTLLDDKKLTIAQLPAMGTDSVKVCLTAND